MATRDNVQVQEFFECPDSSREIKVGLVGTGMVGASFAYSLMQSGLANELVLIDADAARAEGEAMDLNHGLPFVGPMQIVAGGYELLAGCDLVVITAGANQRPGQTRLDLLKTNAAVIRDIVPKVVAASPQAVILIASNPVDILTQIAADIAGLPPGHVFGSGTILDTARFRFLLGEHFGVNPQSVHAYIVAEHGDSAVPVWSLANIAGVRSPTSPAPRPAGSTERPSTGSSSTPATPPTRSSSARGRPTTPSAWACGRSSRPCSATSTRCSPSPPRCAAGSASNGIALSLPTIVGHGGAEKVLEIPMSPDEVAAFRKSGEILTSNDSVA